MTSSFRAADLRLPAGPVDLTTIDSGATPGFDGNKKAGVEALAALGDDLSDLQERLYAEGSADIGHGRTLSDIEQRDRFVWLLLFSALRPNQPTGAAHTHHARIAAA